MHDPNALKRAGPLAERLIAEASQEELAETVRLLALGVAYYQTRYGELPLERVLVAPSSGRSGEGEAALHARSMEILAGVLGSICSAFSPTSSIH